MLIYHNIHKNITVNKDKGGGGQIKSLICFHVPEGLILPPKVGWME